MRLMEQSREAIKNKKFIPFKNKIKKIYEKEDKRIDKELKEKQKKIKKHQVKKQRKLKLKNFK